MVRCLPRDAIATPCASVRLSKRIIVSSNFFRHRVAKPFEFFHTNVMAIFRRGLPLTGALNADGEGTNRDSGRSMTAAVRD